jgi:hypothetical protein
MALENGKVVFNLYDSDVTNLTRSMELIRMPYFLEFTGDLWGHLFPLELALQLQLK